MSIEKPTLELKGVNHIFTMGAGQKMKVLNDINLSLFSDEIVAILGPSGSGKSTCLRIMGGLLKPTDGKVLVNSQPLQGPNPYLSMVFQNFGLLPWLTVYENIELGLESFDLDDKELRLRVRKVIDLVGLEGFEEAYPRELSGGMKQRVGIARALVMDRPIMCLDEPFTSLDVLTAETLRSEVVKLWLNKKTNAKTLVLVTHNISEAVLLAKRIFVMGTNPGYIQVTIKNDLPYPRDEKTLGFKNLVDRIHDVITQTLIPDTPEWIPPTSGGGGGVIETIPPVPVNEVVGLLEFISGRGGQAEVFAIANMLGKDFGNVLFLAKTAELFDFVDTPKNFIVLTEFGKRFIEGDVNVRKRILHEVLKGLRLSQLLEERLKASENYTLPFDQVLDGVKEWLPNENAEQVLDTIIQWGRYGELFGYNDDTREMYLDVGQENS